MRIFCPINKLFFLIIFCQVFICEAFAINQIPSKDNKINSPKAKKNNEIKIYEKNEEDNEGDDNQVNDESTQNDSSSDGDFGIIKNIVEEEKVIEKNLDGDEDKIFLNKEIFNKQTKESLRKIIDKIPKIEVHKLKITNRIIADTTTANNFQSANQRNEFRDITGALRYYSTIKLNKNFEIYGLARLARLDNNSDIARRENNNKSGNHRTFENLGINLSELSLKYSNGNNSLIAGKFTTNFGTAWRWNKGIFVHTIPQNYALNEKLGLTAVTKYGNIKKTGLYNFSLSLFTNDRKNFDNSLLHRKNSDTKSQAIAGDTRGLSSMTLATDINFEFSEKEKLSYHIAYSKLGVNKNATTVALERLKKQTGVVLGMNYKFPVRENFDLETILEYANIKNINGDSNISDKYFTSNLILKYYSNYSLMIGNSNNRNKNLASSRQSTNITEINLGYEFNKNKFFDKLTTQIGYYQTLSRLTTMSNKEKSFALLVRYYKNF
jgi:hypothetical protein